MLPDDLLKRCRAIRKAYRELEIKHHEKEWSIEEWNSLGIDCFSSTTKNKDLLTNSFSFFEFCPAPEKENEMNFGQQIKDLRKKEGLTREQFALKLNVRRQAVSKIILS